MGRIAAYGMDLSPNVIVPPVQICIGAARAVGLDGPAWGAQGLVAEEENVVPRVMQHGFQVINDSTAATHTVPCDDDGRTSGFREVADHCQVCPVAVDDQQWLEAQRIAALLGAL
ncbi:hypothetical protein D3C84_277590 [compost metagenome]